MSATTTNKRGTPRILAVTNMYPTREEPSSGIFVHEQIESLRRLGLSVDVFFVERLRRGPQAYWRLASRLEDRRAAFRPDVVHVMYGGVLAERATRHVTGLPVLVTYHGSDLLGQRGAGAVRRAMAGYGVWCSWRAARRASGIVVVAGHLERRLPREVDRRNVRVIACGVDLERFLPGNREACRDRLGWRGDVFHVLFATNNDDPVKRPELARAAVGELAAGGVAVELHILKGVPYPEVPAWLTASDVILLTSWSEGSPTIVKEALACDRPVVSVAVGDVPEQIAGISGCHIAEGDARALAASLKLVYEGPRVVQGHERMARHSLEVTAERLRQFYEEIVGFEGCSPLVSPTSRPSARVLESGIRVSPRLRDHVEMSRGSVERWK